MASDEAYSAFLSQANQDTGATKVSSKSEAGSTKATDTDVPVPLQEVEQYYVSDADEPFEPVSLKWRGSQIPSEGMFAPLDTVPLNQGILAKEVIAKASLRR